jgi:transposase
VGRAALGKLSTAKLYKLLQLKNIPGRSKISKKGSRIKALLGLVTSADLAVVDVKESGLPSPPPKMSPSTGTRPQSSAGKGVRLDESVMGIDVDSETLVCVLAGPTGLGSEHIVPNDERGTSDLVALCQFLGVAQVAMESTGEYWLRAYWALRDAGIQVLVANSQQTKATQGVKTDKHDARRIALAFRDGRLKPSVLCTRAQYERRKLAREAVKKVQQRARAVNRLKALYHVAGAPKWITKLHESRRGRSILRSCLELDASVDPDAIETILTEEYAHGTHQVTDPVELHRRAREMTTVLSALEPGNRLRVILHLEEYASCLRAAKQLRLQVLRHAGHDEKFRRDLAHLATIPGVGVDLALTILVEVVEVGYFHDAKALVRWAGLNPRVRQSGHRKRANGRISKAGNKYLRWACWIAAQNDFAHSAREGHPVGAFVARLMREAKKPYKVAVTAGGRKMLAIIYHVLQQRRPFEEVYANAECARIEANRKRKLRTLERAVKRASWVP